PAPLFAGRELVQQMLDDVVDRVFRGVARARVGAVVGDPDVAVAFGELGQRGNAGVVGAVETRWIHMYPRALERTGDPIGTGEDEPATDVDQDGFDGRHGAETVPEVRNTA